MKTQIGYFSSWTRFYSREERETELCPSLTKSTLGKSLGKLLVHLI